jgi:PhnB protein
MPVTLTPYLHFRGNTREAMEFYHSVFGGALNVQTFKDAHASQDPSDDDRVMHAQLDGDNGIVLMASDPAARMEDEPGNNCSLSLTGTDEAALRGYFEKLAEGGAIAQPLEKAPWGDTFGMCADEFGVEWLVNISPEPAKETANTLQ